MRYSRNFSQYLQIQRNIMNEKNLKEFYMKYIRDELKLTPAVIKKFRIDLEKLKKQKQWKKQ
jgi:hypothetical protein